MESVQAVWMVLQFHIDCQVVVPSDEGDLVIEMLATGQQQPSQHSSYSHKDPLRLFKFLTSL